MIKLYSYFRSSSSYRVRIALNLKDLDYQISPVHLLKDGGQQFSSEFEKLNRANRIPVLVHDNKPIAQSVAIIEYLEEVFPETPLLPRDSMEKALCRQMIEIINSDIQPLQNLAVLKKIKNDFSLNEEDKLRWIQHWITLGFTSFEELAKNNKGQYSIGDLPSAVDCFLIPQVYNALRFEVNMDRFPTINTIYQTAIDHPAFIKAHPDNQPDTPS